ncbi:MAG: ABC-F family ATP-binding cassette domain-containing protein [Elusimicrobiaceae bacterium]|nr:ABC-F family ATP-binding cassette domain-containing protein [Elusimicrobiaceae bacterium]
MISLNQLAKSFGKQMLFEDATLQINEGDRLTLVGPNGAGKSTLFKLILGWERPDSGDIVIRKGYRTGYLPQEAPPSMGGTVLAQALSQVEYPDGKTEAEAKQILTGLGFKQSDFERALSTLSGGWVMRAALAGLLVSRPDLMLLDEPTNHLDLDSLLWLQDYLKYCRSSVFMISHDRHFINSVCDKIVSMENGSLKVYNGNYDYFLVEREAARERLEKEYRQQQLDIKDLEEFIARNRARLTTATRAQSAMKRLEKIERIELPPQGAKVKIRFPQPKRGPLRVLELKGASKSYGDITVYGNLDFTVERGEKMAFAGHNGAGKSTLLKMLAGIVPADSGDRIVGPDVRLGYFSQHRSETLDPEKTVYEEASEKNTRMLSNMEMRAILGAFLFGDNDINKKTKVLSGGEKSRLSLAKMLINPPDVLLLDEPTTHLDLTSVESLVHALKRFEGAICCISHDIYFMNEVATQVVHVADGKVTRYPGNYDYFQSQQERIRREAAESRTHHKQARPRHAEPAAAPKAVDTRPSLNKAEQRRERARLRALKKEIDDLRGKAAELTISLATADYTGIDATGSQIRSLTAQADEKELFFIAEQERLEGFL